MIKSIAKDFLLQNMKKQTLQKNEEKYAVIKQKKRLQNESKEGKTYKAGTF